MTKTEQRILDYMRARYGHYGAVSSSGHGPEGGRRRGGQREFDACKKLVARGLAVMSCPVHTYMITNRGWSEHCAQISIKLID